MLRSTKDLKGYKLAATDGPIGKVKAFLFDETQFTIRWMVADTGDWLPKRKVLISPITLGKPDWSSRLFPVRLTKSEIENGPELSADEPVSREYERKCFDHFAWPYYWEGAGIWRGAIVPGSLLTREKQAVQFENKPERKNDVLRSANEVMGYHIQTQDDEMGHVEDFIVDDEPWTLRYMIVDTRNWLPGRKVLIAPDWVEAIHWVDRMVTVNLSVDQVKASPEYRPSDPVNREYEASLYDYYGRPPYWRS